MEHLEAELMQDPDLAVRREKIEIQMQEWIQSQNSSANRTAANYTIPVVFHVVYNTTAQNIPDSRLMEQLDVLNKDYRKLNTDIGSVPSAWTSVAADCQVNFCLATLDPNGNPTTGITRTQTSTTSFSTNDNVKRASTGGHDAWDRNKYLNIWVCNIGGGILGYAQFPGGTAATDGVVLSYQYVGITGASSPYNKGRTATHEVGHWLGLYHIWGDDGTACSGSDQVADTPNQAGENYGCPSYPHTDACTGSSPGVMFMNYMDYTDDACMYFFTNGQKARVQATLAGSRASLATSNACSGSSSVSANFTSSTVTGCVPFSITFTDASSGTPTSWNWSFPGGSPSSSTSQNPTVTYNTAGTYNVQLIVSNGSTTDTVLQTAYVTAQGTTIGLNLPFNEDFESNSFNTHNWTLSNPDAATTWTIATVTGSTPGNKAAKMDFYNYTATGERDGLITPYLNLSGLVSAQCDFQHAYRRYNNSSHDSLIVYISTSCGNWTRLLSLGESGSGAFMTGSNTTNAFTPTSANTWCFATGNAPCYTINLTPYVGNTSVKLKFEGYNGYGNNLYIDNINVTGVTASLPPTANFSSSTTSGCVGTAVSFQDLSSNVPTTWSWNFGGGGTPNTSTSQNPGTVFNTPGTYTVTLISSNAFGADTATSTITIYTSPSASISASTNSTCGQNNGSATATATGGSGNYSYSWSNGQSGATASNLVAGTYTVTVTDNSSGCTGTASVTLTTTQSPSVSVSSTNVSCNMGNDGTANAVASGGAGNYTYSWNTGSSNASISSLSAGTFIVTVTDASGCTATGTAIISQPSVISLTMSSTPETPSGAANGTATANASGGTPPYTYLWSNNGTTQTITGLSAGTYSVTITDSKGCVKNGEATISAVVGIAPSSQEFFNVYPNPSHGSVTLNWMLERSQDLNITLVNNLGQQVLQQSILAAQSGEVKLNLEQVPAGIYFLNVRGKDNERIFKLRVE